MSEEPTNAELGEKLAKMFTDKPWKHELAGDTSYDKSVKCVHCGEDMYNIDKTEYGWLKIHDHPCTVPPPIPIVNKGEPGYWECLGRALEMFRKLYEDDLEALTVALIAVYGIEDWIWALTEATARQLFEICLMAKEKV